MTLEEVTRIINSIEEKYPVDEWEVNGVKAWPYLRIELFIRFGAIALGSEGVKTRSTSYAVVLMKSLFKWFRAAWSDRKMNAKVAASPVLFVSDGVSFENIGNAWYDKFCDPWITYYKKNNVNTLMLTLENNYLHPRYSKSKFIQFELNLVVILNLIKSKVFKTSIPMNGLRDFELFERDEALSKFGVEISRSWLSAKMSKVALYKQYFKGILNKVKPKLVFIVSYYYDGSMALISLCRELGIKTVDIQHGIQNDFHLAYGSWSKVPKGGYDSLPDFFNVWSQTEFDSIRRWSKSLDRHQPVITGNIFLQKWKNPQDETIQYFDRAIQSKLDKSKKTILYSKSPQTDSAEMKEGLYRVIEKTQGMYNWLIRLHPSMRNDKAAIIKDLQDYGIKQFALDYCTDYPLFAILRQADLHVTEQSSVVIEAGEFNLFSIITSRYGEAIYKAQIEAEKAIFVEKMEEIELAISHALSSKRASGMYAEEIDFTMYNYILQ